MNLFHRSSSTDTTTQRPPTRAGSHTIRRLARLVAYSVLTGAATALGKTAVTATIWWWTHRG
jgi:hypothetical protein